MAIQKGYFFSYLGNFYGDLFILDCQVAENIITKLKFPFLNDLFYLKRLREPISKVQIYKNNFIYFVCLFN